MKIKVVSKIVLFMSFLIMSACDGSSSTVSEQGKNSKVSALSSQNKPFGDVTQGAKVFEENCEQCHGIAAVGLVKNWQELDAKGILPAPPLNGTAHAWHHGQKALLRTINEGNIPLGGTMPAFKNKLSEQEKAAVLDYIKSLWPEELYIAWRERFGDKK